MDDYTTNLAISYQVLMLEGKTVSIVDKHQKIGLVNIHRMILGAPIYGMSLHTNLSNELFNNNHNNHKSVAVGDDGFVDMYFTLVGYDKNGVIYKTNIISGVISKSSGLESIFDVRRFIYDAIKINKKNKFSNLSYQMSGFGNNSIKFI